MSSADKAKGSASSLNLTISEIMKFLGDDAKRPQGVKLRPFLHRKLSDLSEHYYKRGIRRGYKATYSEWSNKGKLSKKFRFEIEREFFDGEKRHVRVKSRITI
jgi:hypothetical protein